MKSKIEASETTRESASARPSTSGQAPRKARGRPLSFDREAALEKAMHVFWERGYEAASVADLTAAMGITPPSLYTAFGDKEHLFLEAIDAYGKGPGVFGARALAEEPTARRAIQRMLEEGAAELTDARHPRGCMMVTAATNCSIAAEHVQEALVKLRALGIERMQKRIQQGIDDGELPADTDARALANFYATVYQGMSMQAKDGASRKSILASARMAMRSWPETPDRSEAQTASSPTDGPHDRRSAVRARKQEE